MKNSLIFTDLDGTLLNHDTYSFDEALEAVDFLKKNSVPLILSTSKTFSEVEPLQKKLGINCPFVVENGAGTFIPSTHPLAKENKNDEKYIKISTAYTYLELRIFFKHLQQSYNIKGFGDMELEEVVSLTCLDEENAKNSMKRDFTEPFILNGDVDIHGLIKDARQEGLDIVKGGRFYHLISQGQDKAKAMNHLTHLFEEYFDIKYKTVALGDSANDFTMLKEADIGILIPKSDGTYANIEIEYVKKAPFASSRGWNKVILELFNAR